jgi:hypothetical protein
MSLMRLSTFWAVHGTLSAAEEPGPLARQIAARWHHDPGTLRLVRSSANSVYRFDTDGQGRFLRFAAGSEVLGYDTPTSMDHGWGPRVTLFVRRAVWTPELAADVTRVLAAELPFELRGFPTHFTQPWAVMTPTAERPINHGVTLADAPRLLRGWTGIDVLEGWPPRTEDWLTAPEHHLRTAVCGPVYRDDTGELALARERLR